MPALKRPWWDRFAEWRQTLPLADSDVADVAAWFIGRHAREAERNGWQPAHLMGPRGLARTWAPTLFCPHMIAWEPGQMLYQLWELHVGRQAAADGACPLVRGEELTALKGRHLAFVSVAQ